MTIHSYAFLFMASCWGLGIAAHTANLIHRGVYIHKRGRAIRESIADMRRRESDTGPRSFLGE